MLSRQYLLQPFAHMVQFLIVDDKRRRDANGMAVAVVGQQSQVQQLPAKLHGIAVADFDADEKAFAAHFLYMDRSLGDILQPLH